MCIDYLPYSDTNFPLTKATREGVRQIKEFDPYERHSGAELFTCADVWYEHIPKCGMAVKSMKQGAWTYVKNVDFGKGADKLRLRVKGSGSMEIRLNQRDAKPLAITGFSEDVYSEVSIKLLETVSGVHDIYFVFSAQDICLEAWQAERKEQV